MSAKKNPHAVALGRLGGLAGKGQPSSAKKTEAARLNGRKGGRPKNPLKPHRTPVGPRTASQAGLEPSVV
jgi:hypothetical protein